MISAVFFFFYEYLQICADSFFCILAKKKVDYFYAFPSIYTMWTTCISSFTNKNLVWIWNDLQALVWWVKVHLNPIRGTEVVPLYD